jgi:hypothetical protein
MATYTFQEPNRAGAGLLESLLRLSTTGESGAALVAFASADGIRLFFGDPAVAPFLRRGPYSLVVGMDAITDTRALAELARLQGEFPLLRVLAFLHGRSALFHPKVFWFERRGRVDLIVGSGNLTPGGLRNNWEAFAQLELAGDDAREFFDADAAWREEHSLALLPINDPRVVDRARRNARRRRILRDTTAAQTEADAEATTETADAVPSDFTDALVAEIPRAGTRWNQANFDLENFETFFGATAGAHTRVLLRHVTAVGGLEQLESRPGVSRRSRNFSLELGAAAGLAYPTGGRPIAVFVRTGTGLIVYRLLLPGDEPGYSLMDKFLTEHYSGRSDRLRRVRTTVAELQAAWPNSPFSLISPSDL